MSDPSTETLSIRGLPEWLIREYFEELGAAPDPASAARVDGEATRMAAAGWAVTWSSQRIALPGGTLSLTQFDLVFDGDERAVAAASEAFLKKAQRGGG
ncbi:MAG: hypothetical protein V3R95_00030 [Dehalococcoidia bacterium]